MGHHQTEAIIIAANIMQETPVKTKDMHQTAQCITGRTIRGTRCSKDTSHLAARPSTRVLSMMEMPCTHLYHSQSKSFTVVSSDVQVNVTTSADLHSKLPFVLLSALLYISSASRQAKGRGMPPLIVPYYNLIIAARRKVHQ